MNLQHFVSSFLRAVSLTITLLAFLCLPMLGFSQGVLQSGEMATGQIAVVGESDAWTFDANAGDSIVVRAGEASAIDLRLRVTLFSPTGVLLQTTAGFNEAEVAFRATNSGTFSITLNATLGGATGPYRLTLVRAPSTLTTAAGDEGGAIVSGDLKTGTLLVGDLDAWTFNASVGDTIILRAGEASADDIRPRLRLFSPTGVLVGNDSGFNEAEITFRATNSGPYIVTVNTTLDGGSGAYRLSFARSSGVVTTSPGDEGGPLVNGVSQAGALPAGDLDLWSFEANVGDQILIRLGESEAGTDIRPRLRLFSADGSMLASEGGFDATEISVKANASGLHRLVITSTLDGGNGGYRLHLIRIPDTFAILPGDEGGLVQVAAALEGTIQFGDLDPWVFTGCAGETVTLRAEVVSGGSGFGIGSRLYGRDGALLASASSASTATIQMKLPLTGAYTLVIGDGITARNGSGSYRLNLGGLAAGVRLCIPMISSSIVSLVGAGGNPGTRYVLSTAHDILLPADQWTPLRTNTFGSFGEFEWSAPVQTELGGQFFRIVPALAQ